MFDRHEWCGARWWSNKQITCVVKRQCNVDEVVEKTVVDSSNKWDECDVILVPCDSKPRLLHAILWYRQSSFHQGKVDDQEVVRLCIVMRWTKSGTIERCFRWNKSFTLIPATRRTLSCLTAKFHFDAVLDNAPKFETQGSRRHRWKPLRQDILSIVPLNFRLHSHLHSSRR